MNTKTLSHDTIDACTLRLSGAYAIADLLSECNQDELCKGTLSGIAYLLMQMLEETSDLISGKTGAQS